LEQFVVKDVVYTFEQHQNICNVIKSTKRKLVLLLRHRMEKVS
jgi:hypothetical protein